MFYEFTGTPDFIFPYEFGTVCDIEIERTLLGKIRAQIRTPDGMTHFIPYSSMRAFCENWIIPLDCL